MKIPSDPQDLVGVRVEGWSCCCGALSHGQGTVVEVFDRNAGTQYDWQSWAVRVLDDGDTGAYSYASCVSALTEIE